MAGKGTNGLDALEQLKHKDKCTLSPTKHQYSLAEEAWEAARERSKEAKMEIAPYACPDCGFYHLTKRVKGGDVVFLTPQGVTTRSLRSSTRTPGKVAPVRVELMPDPELNDQPVVPGNMAARRKLVAEYVTDKDTVTTKELMELTQARREPIRDDMHALGWTIRKGKGAAWHRKGTPSPTPALHAVTSIDKNLAPWRAMPDVEAVHFASVGDLLSILSAAGLEVRIQIRDK